MHKETVTIQQAIRRGRKDVYFMPNILYGVCSCFAPVAYFAGAGVFSIAPVLTGILIMLVYKTWARPRWRIWAYSNVADIHQLQRSAELANLLSRQSYNKPGVTMSRKRRIKLEELIKRFDEEDTFQDDVSVAQETLIDTKYSFLSTVYTAFVLNADGISFADKGFVPWSEVYDAYVAKAMFGEVAESRGRDVYGLGDYIRFDIVSGSIQYSFKELDINPWKLDLLLYIYRGRYEAKRNNPQH